MSPYYNFELTAEGKTLVTCFRAICGTLCLCQALAVLSAVSIIYLSVIIYLPAKREMESGIGETPVMCTTVEDRQIDNDIEACK